MSSSKYLGFLGLGGILAFLLCKMPNGQIMNPIPNSSSDFQAPTSKIHESQRTWYQQFFDFFHQSFMEDMESFAI